MITLIISFISPQVRSSGVINEFKEEDGDPEEPHMWAGSHCQETNTGLI